MRAKEARVPDFLLEQYALGELEPAEESRLSEALRGDAGLRRRLEELKESNEAILEEAPPAEIAAAIRRRMLLPQPSRGPFGREGRGSAFRPAQTILLPAAAAILVLVGAVMARSVLFPSLEDQNRPKGGEPGLSIYRKAQAGPVELRDGDSAAAGDLLQIRYSAAGERHGAIFSIDGAGTLTRHLPEGTAARAPLLASAGAILGSAYELDAAPGFERFFIIFSKGDFELAAVASALRDLASGPEAARAAPRLAPGLEWRSFLLRKTGGR